MKDGAVGRAIYAGSAPSNSAPKEFRAKEEHPEGSLASQASRLQSPDLRVISSSGERMLYTRDQSDIPRVLKEILFDATPDLVVQPRTVEALSAALRFASSVGIPIIPRGSASSPFGGSVPVKGGLVVDLSRMDKVLSIDAEKRTVKVQGGARWADVDQMLEREGLCLATAPSSKFSTVGGWIATGGMGINSFSRGHLSGSVTEIELVATDGSVRKLTPSDVAFPAVFGSEGQLGVVSGATLSVREKAKVSRPHILFFDDYMSALSFARALSSSNVRPVHIMYESALKISLVNRMLGKDHYPAQDAVVVYIEGKDSDDAFQEFVRRTGLQEGKEYLARYMWNERYFPMKIRKFGPGMLGTEVVAPVTKLGECIGSATELSKSLGVEPIFEVHFLQDDRALLLCFYMTDQGNTIGYTLDAFKSMLLGRLLIDRGARPYSIGVWNYPFSNAEELSKVQRLTSAKRSTDPRGLMNSGKYFTLSGRFANVASVVLSPSFMMPALKTLLVFSPITARLMKFGHRFAEKRLRPKSRTDLLKLADECAMCGACVSVCPAYLVLGDERVTARGKLLTVKSMAKGEMISKEHAHRTFLCMRCKACEQVCQSKLELIPAYETLEAELEKAFGKDAKEIEDFIKYTESTKEFDELVQRGLVIGAPKHGMGGGPSDV